MSKFTLRWAMIMTLLLAVPALAQDATPEVTPESTVSIEVTAETTAEATAEATPSMEMTAEATESMEMTEEVTAEATAEATQSVQATRALSVPLPEEIVISIPGLQPEGVEYDIEGGRFLFGSLSEGDIYQIGATGEASLFIEDEALMSTVGIHIDEANGRLLVTNSSADAFSGGEGMAMLGAYDLATGEPIFMVDLGALYPEGRHFANDVTVDESGTAYVTDSFSPVIYQVTLDGEASIFLENEAFSSAGFGLNGIDFHPDGYLLVANAGNSALLKIVLDEDPNIEPVEVNFPFGADGLVVNEAGEVIAVSRLAGVQYVLRVTSDDDWATAMVAEQVATEGGATTVALTEDDIPYYINAYLNDPAAQEYQIVRVEFTGE